MLITHRRFNLIWLLILIFSGAVCAYAGQAPRPRSETPANQPARPVRPVQPAQTAQPAQAAPSIQAAQPAPAGEAAAGAGGSGLDKRIEGPVEARQMELSTILGLLQAQSGVQMVLGQGISQKVTFSLKNPTVREVLNNVLPANGLDYIETEGGIIRIDKADVIAGMKRPELELVTRTFTPVYIDVEKLLTALDGMKSPDGRVIVDKDSRKIIVTDIPQAVEDMEQLIEKLDVETETRIFQIKFANVQDIADKLQGVINTTEGELFVDARNNTIIVTDTPDRLARAEAIINQLDVEIETRVIPLAFALPEDVMPILEGLLTETGTLDFDQRTSRLIVRDSPSVIDQILKLLKLLDTPTRLVYVEADIIRVNNDKSLTLGTTASFGADIGKGGDPNAPSIGGASGAVSNFASFNPFLTTSGSGMTLLDVRRGSFRFQIDAMVEKKQAEIIASPRLLIQDGEMGSFNLGSQEPYSVRQQGYYGGGGFGGGGDYFTQQFRSVGTSVQLEVYAREAGYVELYINIEDTTGRHVQLANVGEGLAVDGSFINTAVTVKSGRTVVLGGIITRSSSKDNSGVPVLSSIPILGGLFKKKSTSDSKQKMLVFITPTIVNVDDPYEFAHVDNIQHVRDLQKSGATGFLETGVDKKLLDWSNEVTNEKEAVDAALRKEGMTSLSQKNGNGDSNAKKKKQPSLKKQMDEGIIRTGSGKPKKTPEKPEKE